MQGYPYFSLRIPIALTKILYVVGILFGLVINSIGKIADLSHK